MKRILLAAVTAAALIALSTCTNPVSEALNSLSFGLVGTWVNSVVNASSSPGSCGKLTVNDDGTFRSEDTGGGMVSTGTYTVDSVSVSGDSRTFKVHYQWAGINESYVLARVRGGTHYESQYNTMTPYPSSISTASPNYMKATLQQ
jgi:hypothetical protein